MTPGLQTLTEITRDLAAQFLHSVVLIDDRVFVGPFPASATPAPVVPGPITEPSRKGASVAADDKAISVPVAAYEGTKDEHEFDARPLLEKFAEQGLVCTVLPLQKDGDWHRLMKAAQRADIVVIDWKMNGNYGETTIKIIRDILSHGRERLRLIAIYTGEGTLPAIAETLEKELAKDMQEYQVLRPDPVTLAMGPLRIAVYAKERTQVAKGDLGLESRVLEPTALPGALLSDFAKMTSGLVSNVALESLARVRASMHQILRRLRPDLDAAYLSHRTLVSPPMEAEDHLAVLVAEEIATVLDENAVGQQANMTAIRAWVRDQVAKDPEFAKDIAPAGGDVTEAVCKLLEVGVQHVDTPKPMQSLKNNKTKARELTAKFCIPAADATRRDSEFAMLMSLRGRYASRPPELSLGTILAHGEGSDRTFWICVQPECDAARLTEARPFPLLPLHPATVNSGFDVVVAEPTDTTHLLKASGHPYELQMVSFEPDKGTGSVLATEVNGSPLRFTAATGEEYRWLGDLKPQHAQRLAEALGRQQARVAVTETEWMRRSRPSREDD